MEDVTNLINIGLTNPIHILNQHEIFDDFVCDLQMILLTNFISRFISWCRHCGPTAKTGSLLGINQTKVNPNKHRLCPTAPQQTVCKLHLDPQYHIFHWGSTILGTSTLCRTFYRRWCPQCSQLQTMCQIIDVHQLVQTTIIKPYPHSISTVRIDRGTVCSEPNHFVSSFDDVSLKCWNNDNHFISTGHDNSC